MLSRELSGGGAVSNVWCQILADVLDRPIRQTHKPIEANVRGSVYIAGVALGEITFDDIPGLAGIQRTYEPRAAHRAMYDLHFAEFQHVMNIVIRADHCQSVPLIFRFGEKFDFFFSRSKRNWHFFCENLRKEFLRFLLLKNRIFVFASKKSAIPKWLEAF